MAAVARRAAAGDEQWGTLHELQPVDSEQLAADIQRGLYRARTCPQLKAEGLPELSVQARYSTLHTEAGTVYRPWVRVFTRAAAKAEIVRRVQAGESLAYNTRRI